MFHYRTSKRRLLHLQLPFQAHLRIAHLA